MRRTIVHLLVGMMALLASLRPVVPMPAAAAPVVLQDTGVYEEDFTAYAYKDYVEDAEWDIWAQALRLARPDAVSQLWPAMAIDGSGNAVVVWGDDRNGDSDIYAQRLDASGNRLWATDVRVNSDSGTASQHLPAVAVDGSGNALVVWRDDRNGNYDIYAQKLNIAGGRLWAEDVRVNSDSGMAWQDAPAVAMYEDGNAIVVWYDLRNGDADIYAQKLDGGGSKLWGTDVRVSSDSGMAWQYDPSVAVSGGANAIVVWRNYRNGDSDIYAQKLGGGGNKLWEVDVRVNSDSGTASQVVPAVAMDRSGNVLVVWLDWRSNSEGIYAQRLDGSGNRLWPADVRVSSDSGTAQQDSPTVAMYGDGNAIVVWHDYRNGDADIYAQKLDGSGNKLWAVDVRVNSDNGMAQQYHPSVAVSGGGNAAVIWRDDRNGDADIAARKLDGGGNKLWTVDVRVNSDSGTTYQGEPAVALNGSGNSIVVWEDRRSNSEEVYTQRLDSSRNKLWVADVKVNSSSGTVYRGSPAIAMDRGGNAIVVWSDRGDIYAQRLDGSGNRLWVVDVRVNSDSGTAQQCSPAVAMDGGGNAVIVWEDYRNGDADVYAQKLDGSGNKLWTADVRVNSDSGVAYQLSPAVAVDGSGNTVIGWHDYRIGGWDNPDIYAQRLGGSGNRLWATDVRVNSDDGPAFQWYPALAVDGDGKVVVVWTDERHDNGDIYAQRLDESGSRLWMPDVRVNSDSGTAVQSRPAVAVDGSGNAVVVWEDWNGDYDIYAQKVEGDGSNLWEVDMRVNSDSGPTDQECPAVAVDGSGNVIVVWEDYRNGNPDVYAQKINSVGGRAWPADLQVVSPDWFYLPMGTAQSRTVDTSAGHIVRATLTADYQTNGGGVQFYLTNDGGAHWVQVTPGVTHIFATTGSDLRWRAVLTADPVWLRTPVVNSLRIEYSTQPPYADGYEPDGTCAQASPLQVNGAVQAHTFHQPDDEDWAWFDVVAGTTYVLQTTQAGPDADTVLELHDVCDHPILTDTNAFGHDARLVFTAPSDDAYYVCVTNQDGNVYGEGTDYGLSVRTYHPNGLAVVVAGHNDAWQLQSNIDYAADQAYLMLLKVGFPKANVRYLGPNPNRDVDGNHQNDDIVATATITNVRYAIQDWPREQGLALGVPFYLYLIDHGHYDQFLAHGNAQKVTAALLDLWLSNLEATTGADQVTVVIDACKSGSFIDVTGAGPAEISGHNRVIVASTTSQANAYPSERGALFSDVLWTALGDNQDVWSAYQAVKAAVDARGLMQTPWLDDNGDAVADGRDGALARGRGLAGVLGGSEPVIDWLAVEQVSESGAATVRAQVRDDFNVEEVYVEVYPPGYEEPEAGPGETPELGVPTMTLALAGGNLYTATLTGLSTPGCYQVVGYGIDDEGNWAQPVVAATRSGRAVYLPLVVRSY